MTGKPIMPGAQFDTERTVVDCSAHRDRLQALSGRVSPDPCRESESFLRRAALVAADLPDALLEPLRAFRRVGNRDGYLLLRGLPVAEASNAELWLATVGSLLGDIVGYIQEKNGALFHDVRPERDQEHEQSAAGSRAPLALHTERCFHPHLPSHVLLLCLRPDSEQRAMTEVASVRRMLPLLPPEHVRALFLPAFRTGIDYSFGNVSMEKANGPVLSVLHGDRDDPCLRYDLDLMAGLDERACAALAAIRYAAQQVTTALTLQAGDLLVIDNSRAVHGRSAFIARYDGRDRWLKRSYLVQDLRAIGVDRLPGERVIRTTFQV
jgi:L-asparagine oxygenase